MRHLETLRDALFKEGYDVEIAYPRLTARNHAVKGETEAGRLLSSGLSQAVIIEVRDGVPWFSWVWPPAPRSGRGEPSARPEYEPLCPAAEVTNAAARICKVIAVREEPPDA